MKQESAPEWVLVQSEYEIKIGGTYKLINCLRCNAKQHINIITGYYGMFLWRDEEIIKQSKTWYTLHNICINKRTGEQTDPKNITALDLAIMEKRVFKHKPQEEEQEEKVVKELSRVG